MTRLQMIVVIGLFFNVVALAITLVNRQADLYNYGNLLGCVLFGMYIADLNKGL